MLVQNLWLKLFRIFLTVKDESDEDVTVLVATSGDTGGAVANGFLGTKGVNVVILISFRES